MVFFFVFLCFSKEKKKEKKKEILAPSRKEKEVVVEMSSTEKLFDKYASKVNAFGEKEASKFMDFQFRDLRDFFDTNKFRYVVVVVVVVVVRD